jgi:hypothetical protein
MDAGHPLKPCWSQSPIGPPLEENGSQAGFTWVIGSPNGKSRRSKPTGWVPEELQQEEQGEQTHCRDECDEDADERPLKRSERHHPASFPFGSQADSLYRP